MSTSLFPTGYKKFTDVKLMLVMLMPAKLNKCAKCCILDCHLNVQEPRSLSDKILNFRNFAKKYFCNL